MPVNSAVIPSCHHHILSRTNTQFWYARVERSGPDLEEGEIDEDADAEATALLGCEWSMDKQAHAWLALALFERLSGEGARACEAAEMAVAAAAGNQQVRAL